MEEEIVEKESKFSSLEVMARLTDSKIDAREICEKWLLITYDIPKTDEGDKARREFLNNAALGLTSPESRFILSICRRPANLFRMGEKNELRQN